MSDEAVETTFAIKIGDREIPFRSAAPGQLMILARQAERARKEAALKPEASGQVMMGLMQRALGVIESLYVNPEDQAWVEDQILSGDASTVDLMRALGGKSPKDDDDADPKPMPRKRAQKAAKAVASRGRTKR